LDAVGKPCVPVNSLSADISHNMIRAANLVSALSSSNKPTYEAKEILLQIQTTTYKWHYT